MLDDLRVTPGSPVLLRDLPTRATHGLTKDDAVEAMRVNTERIARLQYLLWAESKRSLLLVLQGMDTSGKDGVIRHVLSGVNPQGVRVWSFRKPTEIEYSRDFLWRIHLRAPARGEIGVFNRSHYEDVLVVRVHNLVPEAVWSRRYDAINDFERLLHEEGGCAIVKCFLHISHDEQRTRLQRRLDDPDRNWKFDESDVRERARWDDYQLAYEDALSKCSSDHAPWFVVPSDRKWAQRWAVSQLLVETLEAMDPHHPPAREDLIGRMID